MVHLNNEVLFSVKRRCAKKRHGRNLKLSSFSRRHSKKATYYMISIIWYSGKYVTMKTIEVVTGFSESRSRGQMNRQSTEDI